MIFPTRRWASPERAARRHHTEGWLPATTGLWMWRHVTERCLVIFPECGARNGGEPRPWSLLPGFEEGILETVNMSFDRDTAGAVAGAVLGAYWGEARIPERWRQNVLKGAEIIQLADDLIEACRSSEIPPGHHNESNRV